MFKLVVLSALVAIVAAKPSGLIAPLAYSAPIVHALPAAVSHQSRTDVISKPVIATYAAPAVVAAPVVAAPVVARTVVAAAPAYTSYAHAAPLAYGAHAAPLAYGAHLPAIATYAAAPSIHPW